MELDQVAPFRIAQRDPIDRIGDFSPEVSSSMSHFRDILASERKHAESLISVIATPPLRRSFPKDIQFVLVHRQRTAYAAMLKALPIFEAFYRQHEIFPLLYPVSERLGDRLDLLDRKLVFQVRKRGITFAEEIWH